MWKIPSSLLPSLLLLWPLQQVYAANFTFIYGPGTQCDDFQVSWQGTLLAEAPFVCSRAELGHIPGGVAPFTLTLVPVCPCVLARNLSEI